MDQMTATETTATPLTEPPQRLHHQAFCVKDQEVNRRFIEDVIGIPLTATWCGRTSAPRSAARSTIATHPTSWPMAARWRSFSSRTTRRMRRTAP